jgi:hypothetical protein
VVAERDVEREVQVRVGQLELVLELHVVDTGHAAVVEVVAQVEREVAAALGAHDLDGVGVPVLRVVAFSAVAERDEAHDVHGCRVGVGVGVCVRVRVRVRVRVGVRVDVRLDVRVRGWVPRAARRRGGGHAR